jgi:hypothetical protein
MLTRESIVELRSSWLPNMTDCGLDRLIELLEADSPFLTHGCFTRAVPIGCLATHLAWNHPLTSHLTQDAGISWLHRVAGLNPATSRVIRDWDSCAKDSYEMWQMRGELLAILQEERSRRGRELAVPGEELVEV